MNNYCDDDDDDYDDDNSSKTHLKKRKCYDIFT